jgi:BirA family transcriptional regulator, biotin operon repressor / biotin---[acetyl-CoA-carboxylase] ligase
LFNTGNSLPDMSPGTERSSEAFVGENQARVRDALRGTRFADVTWVAETGSTNDDLVEVAQAGGGERVLITDLQTAGRGRRGRVWDAPSGSAVLMSMLLRDRRMVDGFWSVGSVALAAAETIQSLVGNVECSLKWPNDVMLGEAKVAGVLAQLVDDVTIVGIGINVNWPEALPIELQGRATAVNHHRAHHAPVDRADFAIGVVRRCIDNLTCERDELAAKWKARCSTLGRAVRLELDGTRDPIVGNAVDVDGHGALIIERDGTRTTHHVGDVVHLRPAGPAGS